MKVLEFFGEPLSYGGQEAFILNMYSNLGTENQYTFCTPFYLDNIHLKNLIQKKKDKLIVCNYKFESKLRKLYIYLTAIKECNNYDVIHIHSGSILTLLIVSIIAKTNGIEKVIVHSHATGYKTVSHRIAKFVSDLVIGKYADVFLACSVEAGKFKFPSNIIESNKFHVIKNGIDIDKYKYDINIRENKRQELFVKDKTVICNIGRFSPEKNQLFLLDIFQECLKIDKNSYLLLIGGEGTAERKIKEKVEKMNITHKVLILKNRSDISELLNAADIFVFPSRFEGLGISAIEAQTAGLPTLCAKHLPKELNASSCYYPMSLEDEAQKWALLAMDLRQKERVDQTVQIKGNGYDVKECAPKLENIYDGDIW